MIATDKVSDQIEITPEMIEAGREIFWIYDDRFDDTDEAIANIFRAMVAARRKSPL